MCERILLSLSLGCRCRQGNPFQSYFSPFGWGLHTMSERWGATLSLQIDPSHIGVEGAPPSLPSPRAHPGGGVWGGVSGGSGGGYSSFGALGATFFSFIFLYRFFFRSRVDFGMVFGGQNCSQNRFFGGSFSDAFFD